LGISSSESSVGEIAEIGFEPIASAFIERGANCVRTEYSNLWAFDVVAEREGRLEIVKELGAAATFVPEQQSVYLDAHLADPIVGDASELSRVYRELLEANSSLNHTIIGVQKDTGNIMASYTLLLPGISAPEAAGEMMYFGGVVDAVSRMVDAILRNDNG
jgi:hypothetical protein